MDLILRSILILIAVWMVHRLLEMYWWKPRRIQKLFRDQGVRGPPYMPIIGSLGELAKIYAKAGKAQPSTIASEPATLNNTVHIAFPHLPIWREKYGTVFLYWYGRIPRLSISDPDMIKEFTSAPRKYYQSIQHPLVYNLVRSSILSTGGEAWAAYRKLLNPFFIMESLRALPCVVLKKVEDKIQIWNSLLKSDELEVELYKEFEDLTQRIIVKMIFGDDAEGLEIVKLQSEQAAISSMAVRTVYIPGTRFIPTSSSRRSKWVRRELERIFDGLLERRLQNSNAQGTDWLSQMLLADNLTKNQIVDQCCAILIAGSESTNILLAWICIHLGLDKLWQDKARDEIKQVLLKENRPIIEIFNHLKVLNMIILETLRLYPSIPFVMKHSDEDVKLGEVKIPAGVDIEVPILTVHYDTTTWGEKAHQFDPSRFSEGVSKASKHPMAFMPFMLGPRICPGNNFSLIEVKVTLAMILLNFDITTSPKYQHFPFGGITMKQGKGAPVILRKI